MAFVTANRVKDYTSTAGTGSITLAATPPTGFNQFNGSVPSGSTCNYCIVDGSNYEIGLGTFTEPVTLDRTTPIETKYSGVLDTSSPTAINLSGSTAEVFITALASEGLTAYTGTFTPTIAGSTTAGTGTYTTQNGEYTKIGRVVTFSLTLVWTNLTGSAGGLAINGLPYTSSSTVGVALTAVAENLTYTGTLACLMSPGSTRCLFYQMSTGAALSVLAVDTTGTLYVSGSYTAST